MQYLNKIKIVLFIILIIFVLFLLLILSKTLPKTPEKITPPSPPSSIVNVTWNYEATMRGLGTLGADISTLKNVAGSEDYLKDRNAVYWIFPYPRKVEGADAATFETWDGNSLYGKDKNHIYITGIVSPEVDPVTFTSIEGTPYFRDKNAIYFKVAVDISTDYRYKLEKISEVDSKTVRKITDNIIADGKNVYRDGKAIPSLDGMSFNLIEKPYYSDRNGVYFMADYPTKTITFLTPFFPVKIFTNDSSEGGYVAIGDTVYFGTTTIPGARSTSLKIYDAETGYGEKNTSPCVVKSGCPYATDGQSVFYLGKKIKVADPKTFALVGYGLLQGRDLDSNQPQYAVDNSHVYYQGEVVEKADPTTFIPLVSGGYYFEYGRDAHSVYWKTKQIEGADLETFSIFNGQQPYEGCTAGRYSKDATAVYYQDIRILGADPKTFKVKIGAGSYGEDALHFYKEGHLANPGEFKVCEYG